MKLSLNWLKDYIDISDLTLEQILDQMVKCGFEVEAVDKLSDATNLIGEKYVGGIIGFAYGSFVEYSSTYSYKLNYATSTLGGSADIKATEFAGGLVGYAKRIYPFSPGETSVKTVAIQLCSVNAYVYSENEVGGVACINEQYRIYIINSYFIFNKFKFFSCWIWINSI